MKRITTSNKLKSFKELQDEKKYSACAEVVERNKLLQEAWFETQIWYIDVPNYKEINENLLPHILEEQKKDKGIIRSNSLGWHSDIKVMKQEEFREIRKLCYDAIFQMSELLNLDLEAFELVMSEMWANVSGYGHYNLHHHHPGSHWSVAYYVQAPDDCGKIVFVDPRDPGAYMITFPFKEDAEVPRGFNAKTWFSPVPGRLIIFPSWLKHEVEPNMSSENRISLSGNYYYKRKNEDLSEDWRWTKHDLGAS